MPWQRPTRVSPILSRTRSNYVHGGQSHHFVDQRMQRRIGLAAFLGLPGLNLLGPAVACVGTGVLLAAA